MRRLARGLMAAALAGSLGMTLWSGATIARDPLLRPLIDQTAAQIVAATDRQMARAATPARLSALIDSRLAQDPRNWIALQALHDEAAARGLALRPAIRAAYDAAWQSDSSLVQTLTDCAACAYDPAVCTLSNLLVCQAPIALTPLGDLAGVARAGVAYGTGNEIDALDLGLSVVGLAATGLVVATGGASGAVKAGAATAKLARRMGLLSPRLTAMATDAVRNGIDWAALPAVRSADDLGRAVRAQHFAPLVATAIDLDRLRAATGMTAALHLLPLIDDAADARRLARAGEALGPRLVARAEVLGKTRLMRATVRVGDVALALMSGLTGLAFSAAGMVGGWLQSAVLRALRGLVR